MQMADVDKKDEHFQWYRDVFKRFFDIIMCIIAIILLAIPMLVIAALIKRDSRDEPVLFKQVRIGKHDQPFTILKFRTMSQNAPHQMATEKFENPEAFITPIGSKLRKMSLDELPQLFNVLKGDMSLIGPRPLIPKEKQVLQWRDKCGAENVLPGITGLAQVHGRDELTDKKKAMFDGKYANNVSAWLDLKIFFKTIVDVICGRGIHEGKMKK